MCLGTASETDFQGVYTAMPTSGSVGNVSVDPQFVAHASDTSEEYDYHLQASSPLIDAGDPSMTEADSSTINMGRYGGTSEYTSVPGSNNGGNSGGNSGDNSGDNSGGNSGGNSGDNSGGSNSVPVFEDFEDGQAQGWTASAGTWSIKSVDGSNRYVMASSTESINRAYK